MPNNDLKKLCALHRAHYRQWNLHRFNPVTGDRWPGDLNVFFNVGCGSTNMRAMRDVAEREWSQKNREQIDAIVSDCLRSHGCADTPDILEWCTAGDRLWRAESDGLRFTIDAVLSAPYPDAGHGAGSVDLVIERLDDDGGWESVHESRHTHPRPARLAAHDFWENSSLGLHEEPDRVRLSRQATIKDRG